MAQETEERVLMETIVISLCYAVPVLLWAGAMLGIGLIAAGKIRA